MAQEQLVHINYLTSKPGLNLLREMINNTSNYLGINRSDLLASIRGKTTDHPLKTGKLINDKFQFGSEKQALEHFITAQKTTREVINEMIKIYGLSKDRFGQKTEVYIPDQDINRMLLYTNSGKSTALPEGTVLRTRFEQLRELLLADIALRLDKRAVEEESYDKLSELQLRLNQKLFSGPAGYANLVTHYISYNNEHGIENISNNYFDGATKIEEEMRIIILDKRKINVQIDFGKKNGPTQIIKGLIDFIKEGKIEYNPLGSDVNGKPSLQDRQRFRFVINGDDSDIALVHNRITPFFDNVIEKPIKNDNGQNPTLKKRYIAMFKGIPIEIIYYDVKGYKNSDGHIGLKNKNGLYDGSAHELYEIRRSLPILSYLFPYEVYGKENQTEEEYAREMMDFAKAKSERTAKNIREID